MSVRSGSRPLTILQVSTYERRGGAEQVARNLFEAYRRCGHHSYLVAGRGRSSDPDVIALAENGRRGVSHAVAGVGRILDRYRGFETYRYPATRNLPALLAERPDIVHVHNLHGGYFDLRVLPSLSHRYPLLLTLHDAWLLSGHCAHSLGCQRWRTGCGACPDLTIHPAVRRDATARNWERKRSIFAATRLRVATPSRWLMERVEASLLAPAIREARVIPNGVDMAVFAPGDRTRARDELGLPRESKILLFAGAELRTNGFKDFATARAAAARAALLLDDEILLLALGGAGTPERIGGVEVRFIPFEHRLDKLARYYQAADVYLHAARADTFPTTVLEALACGTAVAATAVGGVPEQIRSLAAAPGVAETYGANEATGVLVAAGDAEGLGRAAADLLSNPDLRGSLARNGALDARARFALEIQRDAYLTWYHEMLEGDRRARSS